MEEVKQSFAFVFPNTKLRNICINNNKITVVTRKGLGTLRHKVLHVPEVLYQVKN